MGVSVLSCTELLFQSIEVQLQLEWSDTHIDESSFCVSLEFDSKMFRHQTNRTPDRKNHTLRMREYSA